MSLMSLNINHDSAILNKTVLIVDDNQDHRYLIRQAIKESIPRLQAIDVSSKNEALEFLNQARLKSSHHLPSLILLDLYLPTKADGLAALQTLKEYNANQNLPPIPVVVFSYSDHIEDVNACYNLGANAYIVKAADYRKWVDYFDGLRDFWFETVKLPPYDIE
jgi:CheY-like chemotaxis protein